MLKYITWIFLVFLLFLGGAVFHWVIWESEDPEVDVWDFIYEIWPDEEAKSLLKLEYGNRPLSVLLVPGHDAEYYGARYRDLTEDELNIDMTRELMSFFDQDENFVPVSARDLETGEYIDPLWDYFQLNQEDIFSYREDLIGLRLELLGRGDMSEWSLENAGQEARDISLRLYGLNKWAREVGFDLVLHVHFNDYRGRARNMPGRYSGASIYVPDKRYPNADISRSVAESVFESLTKTAPVSNLPLESVGVVESEHLAAVAADPSPYAASILIEYGYIYESQWVDPELREVIFPRLAFQTYAGVKNFFGSEAEDFLEKNLAEHNYEWSRVMAPDSEPRADVLALQLFLQHFDLYPQEGLGLSACPVRGVYDTCTELAVAEWQEKLEEQKDVDLASERGRVGEETLRLLNRLSNGAGVH